MLLGITLLAAGLRLWRLGDVPPGLWWDEGHHDWAALNILEGGPHPIYFTEATGFEPLHIYLTALWFRLFGVHYLGTRWVSALAGALTIPALHWAAVEWLSDNVGRARARIIGLLAAGTLSALFSHLLQSRIGFEVVLAPAGTVPTMAALGRGLRTRRVRWFALTGLMLGLTLYSGPTARAAPLIVVAWIVLSLLLDRLALRAVWPYLALAGSHCRRHLCAVGPVLLAPPRLVYWPYELREQRCPQRLAAVTGQRVVDYTVFVHLYADDQRLVSQHDGQPCAGTHPTTRWQAGEIVVDHHRVALPAERDTSHCELCVGLYNLSTPERLPIAEADVPFADQCACIATVVPGRP